MRIGIRRKNYCTLRQFISPNPDEACFQQRNYVIELALAGVKHGLIKPE